MVDSARPQPLKSAGGEAAIALAMQHRPLLAFDFDGTLAPIVADPARARIPAAVALRLRRLAKRLPVAIISGRAVADLRRRLGFEPRWIVGSHGAEFDLADDAVGRWERELDALRLRLAAAAQQLSGAGVMVEDKRLSIALHYRHAVEPRRAVGLVRELLAPLGASLRAFPGKMVENVAAADAPDKGQALVRLVERADAGGAIYAGDDVNDEPVFVAAPPHWLTVRVGSDDAPTRARFFLDRPAEIAYLLDRILVALGKRAPR